MTLRNLHHTPPHVVSTWPTLQGLRWHLSIHATPEVDMRLGGWVHFGGPAKTYEQGLERARDAFRGWLGERA